MKNKKIKPKNMTAEQLQIYKQGKRVAHRNGFLVWLSVQLGLAGIVGVGGHYGYKYLARKYSPQLINGAKTTVNNVGKYLYNYIYYKSSYAIESGKTELLIEGLNQMMDKYDELKSQFDEYTQNPPNNPNPSVDPNSNPDATVSPFNANEDTLTTEQKQDSARFIVGLYSNGEAKNFNVDTFQFADTFNFDSTLTMTDDSTHQFGISFVGTNSALEQGKAVFGDEKIPFDEELYNKYKLKGVKSIIKLMQSFTSDVQTMIGGISLDNTKVTINQLTDFLKTEDCIDYLKEAGFDIGIDLSRLEQYQNTNTENQTPDNQPAPQNSMLFTATKYSEKDEYSL